MKRILNLMFTFTCVISVLALAGKKSSPKQLPAKSIADCDQAYDVYMNDPKNASQTAMNSGAELLGECYTRMMNSALDLRLLQLKKKDPAQFKKEMALQKTFNEASAKFSAFYFSKCQGSACSGCDPAVTLTKIRAQQAEKINGKSLELATSSVTAERTATLKPHFSDFAVGICALPKEVWKSKVEATSCKDGVLADLANGLSVFFSSDENEGDVCAQL